MPGLGIKSNGSRFRLALRAAQLPDFRRTWVSSKSISRAKAIRSSTFREGAQQDEPLGTLCLGECYYEGIGVEKNAVKYLEYAYRAATLGSDEALFHLGEFYRTELRDYQEAMYFYRLLMDRNIGVEADPYEASMNMFTAELLGCEEATTEFDRMNAEGYGIFKKENRTVE